MWIFFLVLIGMELADLVRRSTMTQIALLPRLVRGKPEMKSMARCSHFHSGIFDGCSKTWRLLMFFFYQLTGHTLGDKCCNFLHHVFPPKSALEVVILLCAARMHGMSRAVRFCHNVISQVLYARNA
eukprot:TRINITY_DN10037_c1_g2_i1.p1 TRINITY_DN10037_c1_g2~~TRINITY_DN10037_c1_g2_i1.p1  ORF type:complete len:127 (+),score=14.47 TRINITY_DN10037_c1_g2_i1:201-581(+)